ncbi:MAG: hypothetical protein B0A82_04590 [Alkalinema sp. CACIAM 70d]|nr:MAG: hypothetical protein B0A82_04590 [Alkalinema sp. CACIAM 70d]
MQKFLPTSLQKKSVLYQIDLSLLQIRSHLTPLHKGGIQLKVPLMKEDLGGIVMDCNHKLIWYQKDQ